MRSSRSRSDGLMGHSIGIVMDGMRRPLQSGGEFWGSCRRTLDCGPGCMYAADTARAAAILLEAGYVWIPPTGMGL